MNKISININFNNSCNQNCSYCFRNKTISSIPKKVLYQKIQGLVETYLQDSITIFTIGVMSELMTSKKEVLEFLHDIPYLMRYFFTEDDFINMDNFLEKIEVSSLEELNAAVSSKDFFNFLYSNIDLSNDEYFNEVLKAYEGEKWNILWLNNYILRKLYPEEFKSKVPSYCSILYFTNGTELDKDFFNEIKKFYWSDKGKVIRIALSVDGPEEIHDKHRGKGTYKKVMETYNYIKKDNLLCLNHIGATITSSIDDFYEYFKYFYDTFGKDSTILFSFIRDNPKFWYNADTFNILADKLNKYYDKVRQDIIQHKNIGLLNFYLSNRFLNTIQLLHKPNNNIFRCEIEKQFYIDGSGNVTNCFNNNFKINLKNDKIIQKHPLTYMEHLNVNNLIFCKDCDLKGIMCGGPCYANLTKDPEYVKIECKINHIIYERCKELYSYLKDSLEES